MTPKEPRPSKPGEDPGSPHSPGWLPPAVATVVGLVAGTWALHAGWLIVQYPRSIYLLTFGSAFVALPRFVLGDRWLLRLMEADTTPQTDAVLVGQLVLFAFIGFGIVWPPLYAASFLMMLVANIVWLGNCEVELASRTGPDELLDRDRATVRGWRYNNAGHIILSVAALAVALVFPTSPRPEIAAWTLTAVLGSTILNSVFDYGLTLRRNPDPYLALVRWLRALGDHLVVCADRIMPRLSSPEAHPPPPLVVIEDRLGKTRSRLNRVARGLHLDNELTHPSTTVDRARELMDLVRRRGLEDELIVVLRVHAAAVLAPIHDGDVPPLS